MPHKIVLNSKSSKHSDVSKLPKELYEAYKLILTWIGRDNDLTKSDLANYEDTAARATKALMEMIKTRTEITDSLKDILSVGFPLDKDNSDKHAGIQLEGPILLHSFCPHHLALVTYTCWMAYLPSKSGHVLGLSKLPRLAKLVAKRPVLQEQLAADLADILYYYPSLTEKFPAIESEGSAIMLTGKHACVSCRGVESQNLTTSTELRGAFFSPEMETKFYQMINATRNSEIK